MNRVVRKPYRRISAGILMLLSVLAGILAPEKAALASGSSAKEKSTEHTFHYENVLGSSFEMRVTADDEATAELAEAAALAEIDRLSAIFSTYDNSSEFARWQQTFGSSQVVSPELFTILQQTDRWRILSGGGFDPRAEVFSRLWARAESCGQRPTEPEIQAARASLQGDAWRLDAGSRSATRLSQAPLNLNAIAKGAIIDRAVDAAMAVQQGVGVHGVLIEIGGDLRSRGAVRAPVAIVNPWRDSEGEDPLAVVDVSGRALATSGNSQRGFQIEGRWYSHIIDPRTGRPVDQVINATVIADVAADADALATTFSVIGVEPSLRLAESLPGVECLLVERDGRISRSPGWGRFDRGEPKTPALTQLGMAGPLSARASGVSNTTDAAPMAHELVVNFEINQPEDAKGGRYRRPYVAVWLEDAEGKPVRTLALWISHGGPGPRWISDLKRWHKNDEIRRRIDKKDLIYTISKPTRRPGQYQVVWDWKDDRGKPVSGGEYTVLIEAAREHGTYQLIRQKVTLADKPFSEELKGNVEIKSAVIEYRPRSQHP
jgi:thiamine biosynthesis lipoprotein ApbE